MLAVLQRQEGDVSGGPEFVFALVQDFGAFLGASSPLPDRIEEE